MHRLFGLSCVLLLATFATLGLKSAPLRFFKKSSPPSQVTFLNNPRCNNSHLQDLQHKMVMEYKERRRTEMVRFCAAAGVALVSCRLLMRKVAPVKVSPPLLRPTSFMSTQALATSVKPQSGKDIAFGLAYTTGIISGVIGMGLFGTCWTNDIVSLAEFHEWIRFDK